jgi:hypothetical protein
MNNDLSFHRHQYLTMHSRWIRVVGVKRGIQYWKNVIGEVFDPTIRTITGVATVKRKMNTPNARAGERS